MHTDMSGATADEIHMQRARLERQEYTGGWECHVSESYMSGVCIRQ